MCVSSRAMSCQPSREPVRSNRSHQSGASSRRWRHPRSCRTCGLPGDRRSLPVRRVPGFEQSSGGIVGDDAGAADAVAHSRVAQIGCTQGVWATGLRHSRTDRLHQMNLVKVHPRPPRGQAFRRNARSTPGGPQGGAGLAERGGARRAPTHGYGSVRAGTTAEASQLVDVSLPLEDGAAPQSPGHSPVHLSNARAPPRSISVLTNE